MERQLIDRGVNGIVIAVALTTLTACGGTSSTQQDRGSAAADLTAASALDSAPDSVDAIGSPITVPAPAPTPVTTPDPDSPPIDPPVTETETVDTSVDDGILLSESRNVGCDADASVFNPTMLALINAARSESRMCGSTLRSPVSTVTWNDNLAVAAAAHGNDMASNNFFDHTGSDGLGVGDRASAAQYDWRAVGENIAAGQMDQAEVHRSWLESEGHCVNVMNKLFTEVGAACVTDDATDFGTYWVVVFGDSK